MSYLLIVVLNVPEDMQLANGNVAAISRVCLRILSEIVLMTERGVSDCTTLGCLPSLTVTVCANSSAVYTFVFRGAQTLSLLLQLHESATHMDTAHYYPSCNACPYG